MRNKTEISREVRLDFPKPEEIKAAQLACCGRCCNQCESPAEYAWRKRDVDMAVLLEKAIENELTVIERDTVRLHWFDSRSVTEIALMQGTEKSTVARNLKRAQEKLERALLYAVCYQKDIFSVELVPVVLGKARVIAAARSFKGADKGKRLEMLRKSQNLTREILENGTGISRSRLARLEQGEDATGSELVALSSFYGVTADYILKGELNGK